MDTKFISYRLLKKTLERTGNWKSFLEYVRARKKMINGIQRTDFLKTCLDNDLIPRFLAFRVPSNGCFDDATTHTTREEYAQRHLTLKLWTEAARDFLVSCFYDVYQLVTCFCHCLVSVLIINSPFLIFSSDDDNKIETRQTLLFSNI